MELGRQNSTRWIKYFSYPMDRDKITVNTTTAMKIQAVGYKYNEPVKKFSSVTLHNEVQVQMTSKVGEFPRTPIKLKPRPKVLQIKTGQGENKFKRIQIIYVYLQKLKGVFQLR